MAVTDIYDEVAGPSITEVLIAEAPPPGRSLSNMSNDDLTKLSALHFAPITAKRCEVERQQATVLRRIREAAAMSATEFYYSFPVKAKGGGTQYIEGISIDGAMACLQAYGNAEVDVRPIDIGHSWIFLARFIDHERGTSLIRPFLQRKVGGSQLGGVDEGRRIEIAFNIGASKAARNVVANAIRPFTNFCFEEAKADLVTRVGMKLPENKAKAIARLDEIGVELSRVEAQLGRPSADWTAREVAGLITQIRSVQQGLATVNDVWPLPPPPEPRRGDNATAEVAPGAPTEAPEQSKGAAARPPSGAAEPAGGPKEAPSTASPPEDPLTRWRVPEGVVGQDALLQKLGELLAEAQTQAEVDALLAQNADRIAKITGSKAASWRNNVRVRREMITGGSP